MKRIGLLFVAIAAITAASGLVSSMALKGPIVGESAPGFTAIDTKGAAVRLSDFLGQRVVLEWTNHDCPYVRKHYGGGNMQRIQRALTEEGAVWLTIISSAPGKQGHVSPEQADALTARRGAYPSLVLLDESGDIGRLYRARTTPQMFIIDEGGVLRYQGAIDDKPSANPKTLETAQNYVLMAWAALQAGDPVVQTTTKPYGCSVKY